MTCIIKTQYKSSPSKFTVTSTLKVLANYKYTVNI